jgi:predicted MPP superfamily phosphohydrolase
MLLNERVFPLDNIRFEIVSTKTASPLFRILDLTQVRVKVGFGDYPHDFDLNKAMHDVAQVSEATSSKPDPVVRIVLSHNPDSAERLKNYQCDLILSGHTHGKFNFLIWKASTVFDPTFSTTGPCVDTCHSQEGRSVGHSRISRSYPY